MSLPTLPIPMAYANVDLSKGIKDVDLANLDLPSTEALLQHAEARLAGLEEEALTLSGYKKGRNTMARNGVRGAIAALSAHQRLLSKEPGDDRSAPAPTPDGGSIKRPAVEDGTQPQPTSKRPRAETQTVETHHDSPALGMEIDGVDHGLAAHSSANQATDIFVDRATQALISQMPAERPSGTKQAHTATNPTTSGDTAPTPASAPAPVPLAPAFSATIQADPASSAAQATLPASPSFNIPVVAPASASSTVQVLPSAPASTTVQAVPPIATPSTVTSTAPPMVTPSIVTSTAPAITTPSTVAIPAPATASSTVQVPPPAPASAVNSSAAPAIHAQSSTNAAPAGQKLKKKRATHSARVRAAADEDDNEVEIVEAPAGPSTTEEEYQEVYDVDEGRTVREPKKYEHMGNNWNSLKPKQEERVRGTGDRDVEACEKSNTPFSDGTRTWCLRHHAFLPEASVLSKKIAAHIFINGNGRTRCVIHANNDGLVDDMSVSPDAHFQVTGTPFPPQPVKHGLLPASTLGRPAIQPSEKGKERAQANVLSRNPNFTLTNVMKFFPFSPDGKTRILHCGCTFDGALLDFYLYKTLTIKSISTHQEEPYGRRFSTRDRLAIVTILSEFGVSVDDLFTRDSQGREIGKVDRLKRMIERLELKVDKVAEEEYKAVKRTLAKQVNEAKRKYKSRWVDIPDRSPNDAVEDDLNTQTLLTGDFSDSSDEDDRSYHTASDPDSVAEEYEDGWDGESAGILAPESVMGDSGSEYDQDAEGEIVEEDEEED